MYQKMLIHGNKMTNRFVIAFLFFFAFGLFEKAWSWGFTAHKQINHAAVFTLPPELFKFYKKHLTEITEKAVNADKRRYAFKEEACKHYLDADHYEKKVPLDTIPPRWKEALAKFSLDTLNTYGVGPWNLELIKYQLTKAFEAKNLHLILKLSADLGHYAADLHVPLHSTENYNGQLTNQEGIHGLWESRLYELNFENYDFLIGRAQYLNNVNEVIWQRFSQSYAALDSVLLFERLASERFPDKYVIQNKGYTTAKVYNEAFCNYYHQLLNGMVERRMRASIDLVGSLWFTAWVEAGQPILTDLKELPKEEDQEQTLIEKLVEKGKMIGRRED